jgi:hypothetical protein
MSANLGGTNILRPLQELLQTKTKEGYPRQLFILTDGEVGNTQECIDFVRKHADTTRVFTFGLGDEASQDLVKGLAKAGVRTLRTTFAAALPLTLAFAHD